MTRQVVFEEMKSMDSSARLNRPQLEYVFQMTQQLKNPILPSQSPCKIICVVLASDFFWTGTATLSPQP